MIGLITKICVFLLVAISVQAQQPPESPDHSTTLDDDSGAPGRMPPPLPMQPNRGPMDRAMRAGSRGRWWKNPEFAQKLGLTPEQQKKMDDLFQQSRLKLIDLSAALQKEEAILEPLLAEDRPDESKILTQIDRTAQARAELEKANARMLLGLRSLLTPEQWKKLESERPRPPRPNRP
jgi:periplasmic protein CpxP/Spy